MGLLEEQVRYIQETFKIPVDKTYPGYWWIISLDRESLMPTDGELRQLQSYCEFIVRSWYNEHYQEKILNQMPLPADNGHHTTIFRKGSPWNHEDRGWRFRRSMWQNTGYWPYQSRPFFLIEVLDHNQKLLPEKWERWKMEHSEIFKPFLKQPA